MTIPSGGPGQRTSTMLTIRAQTPQKRGIRKRLRHQPRTRPRRTLGALWTPAPTRRMATMNPRRQPEPPLTRCRSDARSGRRSGDHIGRPGGSAVPTPTASVPVHRRLVIGVDHFAGCRQWGICPEDESVRERCIRACCVPTPRVYCHDRFVRHGVQFTCSGRRSNTDAAFRVSTRPRVHGAAQRCL